MNNTEKLLRAFIEASGYEVDEIKKEKGVKYLSFSSSPAGADVAKFGDFWREYDVDYKVTKKRPTHDSRDIGASFGALRNYNEKRFDEAIESFGKVGAAVKGNDNEKTTKL